MSYVDRVYFEDIDFARTPFYGRYFSWVDRAWEATLIENNIRYSDMVGRQRVGLPITEALPVRLC